MKYRVERLRSGISHNIAYTDETRISMADNTKRDEQVCPGRNSGDSLKRERRERGKRGEE